MNGRAVLAAIAIGELDELVEAIADAAAAREKVLRRTKAADVKIGDRVKLTNIRPKGLDGATGVVTGRRQTSLLVLIDKLFVPVAGRFGPQIERGVPLGVPASCIGAVFSS